MRPRSVVFSTRFERHAEAADRWWKENRETSNAIRDAIAAIVEHLLRNPYIGQPADNARRPGLRRFYLERIEYHIYYRVDVRSARIELVALRHARRRPVRI